MGPLLSSLLKAATSSVFGKQMQHLALSKIKQVVVEKFDLPVTGDRYIWEPSATEIAEDKLSEDPAAFAEILATLSDWRIEQEKTAQLAISEQASVNRLAMASDNWFVKCARPAMLYLGGFSCFSIVILGVLVVWLRPESLSDYVELVKAVAMPLSMLLAAGGVYIYRRTTDKAIDAGVLPKNALQEAARSLIGGAS